MKSKNYIDESADASIDEMDIDVVDETKRFGSRGYFGKEKFKGRSRTQIADDNSHLCEEGHDHGFDELKRVRTSTARQDERYYSAESDPHLCEDGHGHDALDKRRTVSVSQPQERSPQHNSGRRPAVPPQQQSRSAAPLGTTDEQQLNAKWNKYFTILWVFLIIGLLSGSVLAIVVAIMMISRASKKRKDPEHKSDEPGISTIVVIMIICLAAGLIFKFMMMDVSAVFTEL